MANESATAVRAVRAIRNPVRDGFAVLTPQVFRRIDVLARRHAGRPFRIKKSEEMEGMWGQWNLMAEGVFRDVRKLGSQTQAAGVFVEIGVFDISNEIRVAEFHGATRPEIDLSEIPPERIYEFVAWHEIGHVVDNFDHWAPILQRNEHSALRDEHVWEGCQHKLNEVLADRFAWKRMFPGRALPVREGCEDVSAWVDDWIARLSKAGVQRGIDPKCKQCSLDTNGLKFVPASHINKRIPWSNLARPEIKNNATWIRRLQQARHDNRNRILRETRRQAQETAALLLEFVAKKPTMAAYRAMYQGRIVSYVHDLKWRAETLPKVAKGHAT